MNSLFHIIKLIKLFIIHRDQEFFVRFRLFQTILHELHCLNRIHICQIVTQNPDTVQRVVLQQQVITTRT